MAFFRKPSNVVTLFHNPKSPASHQALVLLQKASRFDKLANPRPAIFELEVIEPPLGMTGTQRATILRALMRKEDAERESRRLVQEKERAKAESAGGEEGAEGALAQAEPSRVLNEVAKEDVDWTNPPLPKLAPPLAVWWQQDEVVSGSVDDVRHLVDRLKQDTWSEGASGEGGSGGGVLGTIKGWLS